MTRLLLDCAVRASLVAAATGLTLRFVGIKTASARHRAWTGVVIGMLLLPAFIAAGPRLPVPVLPAQPDRTVVAVVAPGVAVDEAAPVHAERATPVAAVSISGVTWPIALTGAYLVGVVLLLGRLVIGTVQTISFRRRAIEDRGRLTSSQCATPVTVGWLRPSVILPSGWHLWPASQLNAVLTHEHAHVRRRDPLVQWLALLNRAVFWFNPLAWWLERRLTALAEEVCDAVVLEAGHAPEDYSDILLNFARDMARHGRRIEIAGMAMAGPGLSMRIRWILAGVSPQPASRARRFSAALLCVSSAVIVALATPSARTPQAAPSALPRFEVASIKENTSGSGKFGIETPPGARFTAINATLQQLILAAYDLQEFELVGGPSWLNKDHYDIEAKADVAGPVNIFQDDPKGGPSRGLLMLRALLADRFSLVVHQEKKDLPIYALVLDRKDGTTGRGLTAFTSNCDAPSPVASEGRGSAKPAVTAKPCEYSAFPGVILSGGVTIAELASILAPQLGRVVQDRSGLTGRFEFTLRWTPDQIPPGFNRKAAAMGLPAIDENGPTLATALKEQLGLRLESQRGPVPVLVIDRAAHPGPNGPNSPMKLIS